MYLTVGRIKEGVRANFLFFLGIAVQASWTAELVGTFKLKKLEEVVSVFSLRLLQGQKNALRTHRNFTRTPFVKTKWKPHPKLSERMKVVCNRFENKPEN